MRLAAIHDGDVELPAVVDPERGVIRLADLMPDTPTAELPNRPPADVPQLIARPAPAHRHLAGLVAAAPDGRFRAPESVRFAAPYRHPRLIWGIGLNYAEHAGDLAETVPEEPASFIKADHTVIGPEEPIPIPKQSSRTTTEAELGLVIGRYCRDVSEADALDYVFGVCPVLDQTAEDILERNPRFLTRAKNFPGFFSFGPWITPLDEFLGGRALADVEVSTVLNGEPRRTNTIGNMRYSPAFLVSFHSAVMPLYPGDIIATGTPGAVPIGAGDVAECRIAGLPALTNPVVAQATSV